LIGLGCRFSQRSVFDTFFMDLQLPATLPLHSYTLAAAARSHNHFIIVRLLLNDFEHVFKLLFC
jgi:hypothetical protein